MPTSAGIGIQIAEVACRDLQCTLDIDRSAPGFTARFAFQPMTGIDRL
jgi:hypothetical protein